MRILRASIKILVLQGVFSSVLFSFLHSKPNVAYESTKKLSEVISEFSKVAGYRIGIQKPIIFLKPCNEQFKNEIKKIILFIIA